MSNIGGVRPALQTLPFCSILKAMVLKVKQGFTIVELLIVVVVIAILAAVTIVAYNGIKDRAATTSMKSDLNAAAKKMELARVDNSENYPASFPAGVTTSSGNVIQLTAVTDATKSFCINAYGPGNKVASLSSGGPIKDYLCPGATVGSAIGGTVPTAPRGVNLATDFSTWTTSGGMSYNAGTGELVCTNLTAGSAASPIYRTDGAASGTYRYDAYATVASSTRTYSGSYASTSYYAANGTTGAFNTAPSPGPYSGNGNAPALAAPLSSWQTVSWGLILGPNIIYTRLYVSCDTSANAYTSDTHYKNPYFSVQ